MSDDKIGKGDMEDSALHVGMLAKFVMGLRFQIVRRDAVKSEGMFYRAVI